MSLSNFLISLYIFLFPLYFVPSIAIGLFGVAIGSSPETHPSHRFLKTELEEDLNPETALLKRLRLSGELKNNYHQDQKGELKKQLTELSKKLLVNPDFLNSLQEKYSKNEIEKIIRSLNQTENIEFPSDWIQVLRAKLGESKFNSVESDKAKSLIDLFQQKEKTGELNNQKSISDVINKSEKARANFPHTKSTNPETPLWSNLESSSQDWIKNQSELWAPFLKKWLQSPSGKTLNTILKTLSKNPENAGKVPPSVTRKMSGISRLSSIIPRSFFSQIPKINSPSHYKYRIKGIHFSNSIFTSKFIAIILFFACFLISAYALLSKIQKSIFQAKKSFLFSNWRGHWSNPPEEIINRKDLAKAFEDLSFHLVGSEIKTKNHLEIARKLEIIPSLDPERRIEAIRFLVQQYEKARYCPENEPFQDEIFRRANREIRFLAGEIHS
ncbi:MAG: hypothetical protein ACKO23_09160 [Gemmataceae bacterium]